MSSTINFPYILGGDLVLDVTAEITDGFVGSNEEPMEEAEMNITEVKLPDGKTFETDDIYFSTCNGRGRKYTELDKLIIEAGWEYDAEQYKNSQEEE